MAVPFSIYMNPPYVLVFGTYGAQSNQELIPNSPTIQIAKIEQVNSSTVNFAVGDVVFYKQNEVYPILLTKDNSRYNIISETSIFFKEA